MKVRADLLQPRCALEAYPRKEGHQLARLRENFAEFEEASHTDGESIKGYEYDEYTLLLPQDVTLDWVETNFDALIAEAREREQIAEAATPENVMRLTRRNAELEQQNAMLTECLLEMSEMVYA